MRPANVFQLEWSAAAQPRSLAMRLGLSLLLALPLILIDAPVRVQSAGLAMLVVFTSLFGAAVATTRRKQDGRWAALRLLPIARWAVVTDYALAASVLRLLPAGVVVALFVVARGRSATPAGCLTAAGSLVAAVVCLTLVGVGIGLAVPGNAEVHLLAALAAGLVGFLSGLAPAPQRLAALVGATSAASPVGWLARRLEAIASGGSAPPTWEFALAGAVVVALGAPAATRWLWAGLSPGRRGRARPATQTAET